ncbi:MAG: LPS export ABC transporter permease LptG [Gammaproteobacteria bacterium]|nr:LPS export ABC transporter permease LptG [Gammaproteobacteria bacterium]
MKAGIAERYLARHLWQATAAMMIILLALFSFVTLVDELENVGKGSFTTVNAIAVVALTTLKRAIDLLPVATLLGTVMGLGTMAGHREIIALRAVGWSPWRIALATLRVAAILVGLLLAAQHLVVSSLEQRAAALRSRTLASTAVGVARQEFWTRTERQMVRVGAVDHGREPQDIEIYELGDDGLVRRITRAESADILDDTRWLLHDVLESEFSDTEVRQSERAALEWRSSLSPKQLGAFLVPSESLSIIDLARYIRKLEENGLNTQRYRIALWQQLGAPLAVIAMALLGLPFVMGSVRGFTAGLRITIGAGIGIVFYLAEQITGHLALIVSLPVIPSALAPEGLALLLALFGLWRIATPRGAR